MTSSKVRIGNRRLWLMMAVVVLASMTAFVTEASAACRMMTPSRLSAPGSLNGLLAAPVLPMAQLGGSAVGPLGERSIVGLWRSFYRADDGSKFDESLQQFHDDGLELMISNALSPDLGNVCIGVWAKTGPHQIKLRHVTWNFNLGGSGVWEGLFQMIANFRLDERDTLSGRWVADSFDTAGKPVPDSHFEGTVQSKRITVQ